MPKIKFTATPKLPADYKHLGYVKGMEIEGTKDWCDKWVIGRNVAVYVGDEITPVAAIEPVVEPVAEPVVEPTVEPIVEPVEPVEPILAPRRGRPASR